MGSRVRNDALYGFLVMVGVALFGIQLLLTFGVIRSKL
jgi:hypothetical protein